MAEGFCLAVEGWGSIEDPTPESIAEPPAAKTRRLSFTLKKRATTASTAERFAFVDEAKSEALSKKYVPKNTEKSTQWALSTFLTWRDRRNECFSQEPEKQVPLDLLGSADPVALCKWLILFVAEVRKKDGAEYPPKTMYLLLTGILRHMRSKNPACPNFLDTHDPLFSSFHNALDNVLRDLRAKGIGAESRQTEAFSKVEEEQLWDSGVLACNNPKSLLRAVFYLNGKYFCLRGGEEQRNLKISQLERLSNPDRYVYTENTSKNRYGGLKQMRVKNKLVPIVAVPECGERCHVYVLDTYLAKLPPEALEKDNFYVQPVADFEAREIWYTSRAIGKNTLGKMVKEICVDGNVSGRKTNHSLRATGVSDLFQAGVPDKIVKERSGHLSMDGLRQYQHTTAEQEENVSKVLATGSSYVSIQSHHFMPRPSYYPTVQNFSSCNVTIYNAPPVTSPLSDTTNTTS